MNYVPLVETILVLLISPFLNFRPLLKPKEQPVPGQIFSLQEIKNTGKSLFG